MPTLKTLTRSSITFAALSILGGAITLNESLRHLRRATARASARATTFGIKATLAALSLVISIGFIIAAIRYLRDASTRAHLRLAALIGIGVELLYQGFEIYFYATPPTLHTPQASKALLMTGCITA